MKNFSGRFLLIILASLALTFCSDPVKVGDDSPDIAILAAWLDDFEDADNDGFSSFANIYFQISTSEPVDVFFRIGYKVANTSGYTIYKETAVYTVSDGETWYVSLGSEGDELQGYYDFSVEIYYESELVDILTSEDEPDISDFAMEYPENDVQTVDLIFNNDCPTSVLIDITGYGSITVEAKSTNTYTFTGNPGTITFNGQTQIPVGGNLAWSNRVVDLTGLTSYTFPTLYYTDVFFFAYITNNGGSSLSDFYVNTQLGESNWFYVDRTIPNDGVTREFGYYEAYPGTVIQVWSTGAQTWYEWNNLSFPGGNNQVISLTNGLAKTSASFNPKPNANKTQRYFLEAP